MHFGAVQEVTVFSRRATVQFTSVLGRYTGTTLLRFWAAPHRHILVCVLYF